MSILQPRIQSWQHRFDQMRNKINNGELMIRKNIKMFSRTMEDSIIMAYE